MENIEASYWCPTGVSQFYQLYIKLYISEISTFFKVHLTKVSKSTLHLLDSYSKISKTKSNPIIKNIKLLFEKLRKTAVGIVCFLYPRSYFTISSHKNRMLPYRDPETLWNIYHQTYYDWYSKPWWFITNPEIFYTKEFVAQTHIPEIPLRLQLHNVNRTTTLYGVVSELLKASPFLLYLCIIAA